MGEPTSPYWPRRLLRIHLDGNEPRLESFTRVGASTYDGEQEPRYCALSYTWGKWKRNDNQGLREINVYGVPWPIPTVKRHHFEVPAFWEVVRKMYKDRYRWTWIDIGCIDQRKDQADLEIQKQYRIFKNAKCIYAWLANTRSDILRDTMAVISGSDFENRLSQCKTEPGIASLIREIAQKTPKYPLLKHILADTYFCSVWTIQEAFAQPENTTMISSDGKASANLSTLVGAVWRLRRQMWVLYQKAIRLPDAAWQILKDIEERGILDIRRKNPNALIFVAGTRSQHPHHEALKLHKPGNPFGAILQTYEFDGAPTLRENNENGLSQITKYLLEKRPLRSQLFIHTDYKPPEHSLRVAVMSTVPYELEELEKCYQVENIGGFTFVNSRIQYSGEFCLFDKFEDSIWRNKKRDPVLCLDRHTRCVNDEYNNRHGRWRFAHTSWEDTDRVIDKIRTKNLKLLNLGYTIGGRRGCTTVTILCSETDGRYERLGVCIWDGSEKDNDMLEWERVEAFFVG